ncbi:zinc finger protein 485-like isoform X2 [Pleurodeles waltl]|uniref:zinc finger protein 485-like isoform X2 n=1 Tax=Pleurodeles waltl TaxID=8319 RepID=UPI003709672E
MYGPDSDEKPITFCDIVACFSEEEWKLLEHWQKDLYKNVMKEIHHALISLGPLIAASIFSLKPKQMEDLCSKDVQDFFIKDSLNPSSGATLDVLFRGKQQVSDMPDTAKSRRSKEHPVIPPLAAFSVKTEGDSYCNNHLDSERNESTTCTVAPESMPPVASMGINEAGETYPIDIQDYQGGENCASTSKETSKVKVENSAKCNEKLRFCKPKTKKNEANLVQITYEPKPFLSLMQSRKDGEMKEETSAQWQSVFSQPTDSSSHPVAPRVQASEPYNTCEGALSNENNVPCKPNALQNFRPYSYSQNTKMAQRNSHSGYQRTHQGRRRHTCTVCGKSFTAISNLIKHERIHTGERPFHCTICGKSFNQLGALHRHQKMHTGERPYQCNICGNRFNRTDTLMRHHKRHEKMLQKCDIDMLEIV